jgi:PAS domain S-box-containing protein
MEAVTVALSSASYTGYRQTLVALAFMLLAYALSRTRHFEQGAILSIATVTLVIFASMIAEGNAAYIEFLDFLILPLLLGSLFLSARVLFWLTVLDVVGILLVPIAIPKLSYDQVVVGPVMFITLSAGLFLLAMRQRDALERRRRAELAESEARLANIINLAGDAIVAVDEEQRIVLFNREAESVFGYTAGEILGQPLDVLLPPERVARHHEHMRTFAESPGATLVMNHGQHVAGRRKDGSEFPAEGSLSRMSMGGRQVFTVILRDITERRKAEEAVKHLNEDLERRVAERTSQLAAANADLAREIAERRRAEEHLILLERAIESTSNGVLISDRSQPDDPVIYVNPAFTYITGYAEEDVLGHNCRFLQGHDRDQSGLVELRAAVREGRECRVIVRNYRKDGSLFWNELHLSPVRDDVGRVTHFVGIQTDITELKLIEEAVRASEERFRQLAENIHEVFFIFSADTREILYLSPAYEEIWGRTCDSLYRDPLSFLDAIHPDDRERVAREMLRRTEGPGFGEFRIVRPDDTVGWVWVRTFPIRSQGGEVYRIAGVAEDVTERKLAEEEVHKALEQERELNDLKSRFVSMMSHEFRTPLTAILTSTELLQYYHHKLTEARQAEHFNRIRSSVKNMTQMLEDILLLGKSDTGKLQSNPEPLDLVAFCRDLAEEMQLSAGNQHTIEFIAHGDGANARLDPKLLRQILANLLSNAMKYSPSSDAVHFEMRREDGHVVFSVRDQGIGIPPEEHARMFETFHRARNVGAIPGTGLGLAIVKRSVDLCVGMIAFDSAVGLGTTFTIALPLHYQQVTT